MAHLPNFRPFSGASNVAINRAAEDCDPDKRKGGAAAAEDEDDDEKEKKKESKAASDKDEDGRDNGSDKPSDKNGKAAKDEGEEDDEKDEDGKKKGARAERNRIRAILTSDAATNLLDVAMNYAFETDMSAKSAIGMLKATQMSLSKIQAAQPVVERRDRIADRMETVKVPAVGSDAPQGSMSVAEQIIMAGKKRRGEV